MTGVPGKLLAVGKASQPWVCEIQDVPHGNVICNAGKQTTFANTQESTNNHEPRVVLDQAQADCADRPSTGLYPSANCIEQTRADLEIRTA